jgi:hypothetical protein
MTPVRAGLRTQKHPARAKGESRSSTEKGAPRIRFWRGRGRVRGQDVRGFVRLGAPEALPFAFLI